MQLNWKTIALLCIVLFGSFFITLWLTTPPNLLPPPQPPVFQPGTLKTISGTSNTDLLKKLSASGFRADESILGHIDEFASLPDKAVHVVGWALDQSRAGTPLTVAFYVDGDARLTVQTAGSRDDVAKSLNLPEQITKNVAFSGTFTCDVLGQAMALAINPADGRYAQLVQRPCPSRLF